MIYRSRIIYFVVLLGAVLASYFLGKYSSELVYYSDEEDISAYIQDRAIAAIAERTGSTIQRTRQDLASRRPDYFRAGDMRCVRYMPSNFTFGHVVAYCEDAIAQTYEVTYY